jgi:PTH2 family peptidyl-tRNA hydrolase
MPTSPKQVIVMRTDLNMRKGKMAAQASHASMAVILDLMKCSYNELYETRTLVMPEGSALSQWLNGPFKKICVGIGSEAELLDLYDKAKRFNIPVALITDSGLTEFGGVKTHTCIAIGPDFPEAIDALTSELKLL